MSTKSLSEFVADRLRLDEEALLAELREQHCGDGRMWGELSGRKIERARTKDIDALLVEAVHLLDDVDTYSMRWEQGETIRGFLIRLNKEVGRKDEWLSM